MTKKKLLRIILILILAAAIVSTVWDALHAGDGEAQTVEQTQTLPSLATVPPEEAGKTPLPTAAAQAESTAEPSAEAAIDEDGSYTSKDDVALYIYTYGKLPENFITKKDAQALGWQGGSLEGYAPGMSIGGDRFGNYEGILPEASGRRYTECDIDTPGRKSRGAKRIVFSNDGLIFYTDDHYESFEQLY